MAWSQAWRRAREQRVQPRGVSHLQPASASLSAATGEHLPPLPSPPQPLALHPVCVCPRDAGGGGADASEAAWPAKATLQQRRGCRCAPIPAVRVGPGTVSVAFAYGPAFRTCPCALQVRMALSTTTRSTSTRRSPRSRRRPPPLLRPAWRRIAAFKLASNGPGVAKISTSKTLLT